MDIDGVKEIRFKGYKENNDDINKLYLKLANPLKEENNTQGKRCILYSVNLQNWKERFVK